MGRIKIGGINSGVMVEYTTPHQAVVDSLDLMTGHSAYTVFANDCSISVGTVFQETGYKDDGSKKMTPVWTYIDCNGNKPFNKSFSSRYAATVEMIKIWERQRSHNRADQENNSTLAEGVVEWRKWAQDIIGEAPANAPAIQRDLINSVLTSDEAMRAAISKSLELK